MTSSGINTLNIKEWMSSEKWTISSVAKRPEATKMWLLRKSPRIPWKDKVANDVKYIF